jgi:hypothetical protein
MPVAMDAGGRRAFCRLAVSAGGEQRSTLERCVRVAGVWLWAMVVDPQNSANVYAAAGGRVFRSTDGG